jgi:hypothetical protein
MALVNPGLLESLQRVPDKSSADTFASICLADSQVVEVSSPPVRAAEHCTDKLAALTGHKAHAAVPLQVGSYAPA